MLKIYILVKIYFKKVFWETKRRYLSRLWVFVVPICKWNRALFDLLPLLCLQQTQKFCWSVKIDNIEAAQTYQNDNQGWRVVDVRLSLLCCQAPFFNWTQATNGNTGDNSNSIKGKIETRKQLLSIVNERGQARLIWFIKGNRTKLDFTMGLGSRLPNPGCNMSLR